LHHGPAGRTAGSGRKRLARLDCFHPRRGARPVDLAGGVPAALVGMMPAGGELPCKTKPRVKNGDRLRSPLEKQMTAEHQAGARHGKMGTGAGRPWKNRCPAKSRPVPVPEKWGLAPAVLGKTDALRSPGGRCLSPYFSRTSADKWGLAPAVPEKTDA